MNIYSIYDLETELGVPYGEIYYMLNTGKVHSFKKIGKFNFFNDENVEEIKQVLAKKAKRKEEIKIEKRKKARRVLSGK